MTRAGLAALPALLLGCATAGGGGVAAPAALSVSPDEVLAPVRREVLSGFNAGNWVQVAEFGDDLRAVRPAELRFPGGNVGDDADVTGFALGIFRANLSMLGDPAAVIHTRVFPGGLSRDPPHNRPEDAADLVRWARDRGIRVRYWLIGNEPDLYATNRGDPSWTPERYCQAFRAQAAAIKAVDPSARVGGPSVSGGEPGRTRFLERFVEVCGDAVDVLTWHLYPDDGTAEDEAALATAAEADRTAEAFRALWADPARNPLGHGRPAELAVTEYGLSWRTASFRHLTDLTAAMWALEVALRLDAQGLASAHYFALQGVGGHGLLDQAGVRRPTWYAFHLLAELSGDLVAAGSDDPGLWVHAARDGGRLDVVVTNRTAEARPLAARLPGFALRAATAVDAAVVAAERPPAPLRAGAVVTLPPRSIVHLRYERP